MEKLAKSSAINYGYYLAITLALLIIIAYAVNLEYLAGGWYSILLFICIIIFGIISIVKAKSISGNFLNFKHSFTAYFITVAIGVFASVLIFYILFNFIDTGAAETLKQLNIEAQVERMQSFGMNEDALSEMMIAMEDQNSYSIPTLLLGLVIQLVIYSIIGLIAAAFIKKNPENDY